MRRLKLAHVINKICMDMKPGKIAMQKMIYFLQEKGLKLGYVYGIHHYGPYCSSLENDIRSLEIEGVVKREQYRNALLLMPSEFIELYISDSAQLLSTPEIQVIESVIKNFGTKSPADFELLSTVHFVYKELVESEGLASLDKVISGVHDIKGDKFSDNEIKEAINVLTSNNFIYKKEG